MSTVTASNGITEPATGEFDDLFREHYAMVYRSAFSVVFNAEDAEDVVQTIFLRLLRNGLPAGTKNPKGYLYRAAVNEALNVIRAKRNTHSVDQRVFDKLPGFTPPPESSMSARIAIAMAQLRPSAVEMLVLRYEHHYSDVEIAKLLGKSRGVVAVTLYRARARLKKLLGEKS